jgi:putative flippase GtrA
MLKRELAIFLVVGASTVLVDYLSYLGLVGSGVMEIDMAKATGFLIGTLFAYFANRFWTFGQKSYFLGSEWRFTILYASSLGVNVLINSIMLKLFPDEIAAISLAFFVATGVSASLNFVGMKFFVFKPIPVSELR